MTIPEYYEKRFGRSVRIFGGFVLALAGILNMGLFLRAGADFVTGVTGMEDAQVKIVMTVLLALVLFYTMLGGMISIVVTDYVQFVVLSLGLLITCVIAVSHAGWDNVVHIVQNVETIKKPAGEAAVNPFHTDGYGGGYVAWQAFLAMVSCAIWQTAVMRACSAQDEATVKRIYTWSSIGFLIRCLVPMFLGLCALAYFSQDVETAAKYAPLPVDGDTEAGKAALAAYNIDSLKAMPVFLGRILPVGVLGLVTAGMLAAFMSTHDSYLLCWSSVLTQDVIAPLRKHGLSERARLSLTRWLILAIGIFLLVWGLWYELDQDLWGYMAVTGAIYFTGAFALLVGGLYTRIGSRVGALGALYCGLFALLGLGPVRKLLNLEALETSIGVELNEVTIGLGSVAMAVVAYFAGSLIFPDRPSTDGTRDEEGT